MLSTAEFYREFPNKEACKDYLKKSREEVGICCKKCDSKEHYWLKSKKQWQCKNCRFRTTLTSGTLFHASNVSLFHWFQAIYFMCTTQKAVSANEMKLKLGFKRYEPVWYMMHKIRLVMNDINSEMDSENEKFLGGCALINRCLNFEEDNISFFSNKPIKHSQVVLFKEKGHRSFNKVRFKVYPLSRKYLEKCQNSESFYSVASVLNGKYKYRTAFRKKNNEVLAFLHRIKENNCKWVKNLIENLSGVIYVIYHRVSAKYLQLYLDEFSFKYNMNGMTEKWSSLFYRGLSFYW